MRKKQSDDVQITMVDSDVISHRESDKEAIEQRKVEALAWATKMVGPSGEMPYAPLVSPKMLYDDVMNDPILSRCLRFIARTVGGLGYNDVPSPYVEKVEISEKKEVKTWISKTFHPSLPGTIENFIYDFVWSGMAALLVDTNSTKTNTTEEYYFGKKYTITHYEATKIKHINRMRIQKLLPRTINNTTKSDPMDVIFPRFIIQSSLEDYESYFYAKTYGDPRFFERATGKQTGTHNNEKEAPQVICWTQYCPQDEASGYPSWMSSKIEVDTHYECRKYEYDHFKNNCIPNLIIIAPITKTKEGKTGGQLTKEFLEKTVAKRADGGGNRTALVLEFPTGAVHSSTGQIPIEIREIKGPPPDQFIALKTQIVQNIATSCDMSANLILPYDKGMGSGKDKIEDLRQFKTFTAEPLRTRANREILEPIVRNNSRIRSLLIELFEIDTSDPEMESKIAKAWDEVSVLNNGEKREKMKAPHMIYPDDAEKSKQFNEIVFMDFAKKLFTFDVDNLDATLAGMETLEPNDNMTQDQQNMAKYLKKFLRGMPPSKFRAQFLPLIRESLRMKD